MHRPLEISIIFLSGKLCNIVGNTIINKHFSKQQLTEDINTSQGDGGTPEFEPAKSEPQIVVEIMP